MKYRTVLTLPELFDSSGSFTHIREYGDFASADHAAANMFYKHLDGVIVTIEQLSRPIDSCDPCKWRHIFTYE